MGIGDHGMLAVSTSLEKTTVDTLKAMLDEDSELVTVYYGSDVSAADAQALTAKLQKAARMWKLSFRRAVSRSTII